jgi:nitroreductase
MNVEATMRTDAAPTLELMRKARQFRQYRPDPVPDEALHELLELARWTGSSRNTQPWHFIVITDKDVLYQVSRVRTPINWVADAPLAIGIVLNGGDIASEAFDEGRVTERLLIGARLLGLGAGTAWFGDAGQVAEGKRILGIPEEKTARSVVAIGYPITSKDPRPNPSQPGRKPLSELVSYNRYGNPNAGG